MRALYAHGPGGSKPFPRPCLPSCTTSSMESRAILASTTLTLLWDKFPVFPSLASIKRKYGSASRDGRYWSQYRRYIFCHLLGRAKFRHDIHRNWLSQIRMGAQRSESTKDMMLFETNPNQVTIHLNTWIQHEDNIYQNCFRG